MARKDEAEGTIGISEDGRMRAFVRFVLTVLIMVAIVLVGLCFLVPRKGMKPVIESALSKRIGMVLTMDGARIGWPYVLVVEGPVSADFDASDKGGFKARELRVGLGWRTRFNVNVEKAELRLVSAKDDTWSPQAFARLGPVPTSRLGELSRVTESFRRNVSLSITDCTVRWMDGADGAVQASAQGVAFRVEPAGVPGRRMYWHRLSVYNVVHPDGTRVTDVEREWLASERAEYVEVYRSGKAAPDAVRDFWDPPCGSSGEVEK